MAIVRLDTISEEKYMMQYGTEQILLHNYSTYG